jgi:replicative DNA helicase
VPTGNFAKHYAEIIKVESDKRKVMTLGHQLIQDIQDGKDIKGIISQATDDIFGFTVETSKPTHIKESIKASISHIEAAYGSDGVVGIPSGLKDLDGVLGGFKDKFYVLAARPGLGKSALAKCVSTAGGREGKNILVFSIEMPKEELGTRYLSGEALINSRDLENGKLKDNHWSKLFMAADNLSKMPIYIDDNPRQTEIDIWSKARHHKVKHGLDMVIVDYLQLIGCSRNTQSREQEVAHISKTFKGMQMDLGVPVICLAQLSRECEKHKRAPILSDLRESGAIEQDADVVLFLHHPWKYNKDMPKTLVEAIVEKHRGGPTGYVDLYWEAEFTNFKNMERRY